MVLTPILAVKDSIQLFSPSIIPFLGFQIFQQKRILKRRKGLYFQRKLRQLLRDYAAGKVPLEQVSAQGWVNHVRYANTLGLRKAIFRKHKIPKREG